MEIVIKEYQPSDKPELIRLMEILQDYLAGIDPLHRMRRKPEYGELYTAGLLKKIEETSGIIYLAKQDQETLGCVAGNIEEQSEPERAGTVTSRAGRILELVVGERWRGGGIGKMLMCKMEDYFRSKGCDIVRVEVFLPNVNAHSFYDRLRYHDRAVDMVKLLSYPD